MGTGFYAWSVWRDACTRVVTRGRGCYTLADFFVVELQIFCRGQIGLRFVGPSDCRTLANFFLSRLTALRLGAESSKIKMAPIPLTRRKLKLALFTSTFLRKIKRRRKSSTRTTWVKSWIAKRNKQGVYNNLIQELGNEDPIGFRWYFRLAKKKNSKKYSRYCNKLVLFYRCPMLDLRADLSFDLRHVGKGACPCDSHDIS